MRGFELAVMTEQRKDKLFNRDKSCSLFQKMESRGGRSSADYWARVSHCEQQALAPSEASEF